MGVSELFGQLSKRVVCATPYRSRWYSESVGNGRRRHVQRVSQDDNVSFLLGQTTEQVVEVGSQNEMVGRVGDIRRAPLFERRLARPSPILVDETIRQGSPRVRGPAASDGEPTRDHCGDGVGNEILRVLVVSDQ